jgi:hypothetical protein
MAVRFADRPISPAPQCAPNPLPRSSCCSKRAECEDAKSGDRWSAFATIFDGNTLDGACHLESGCICPNPGQPCKAAIRCGDRVAQPTIGEVCDDGANNGKDGLGSATCKTITYAPP